jgi:hypothetical protein
VRIDLISPCFGSSSLSAAAADEDVVVPRGPERDARLTEPGEVERVHALGRRERMHAAQVLFEERADLGAGEVVGDDAHGACSIRRRRA